MGAAPGYKLALWTVKPALSDPHQTLGVQRITSFLEGGEGGG